MAARAFVEVLGSGAMYLSSFLLGPLRSVEHIMRPRKFLVSTEEALVTK
jgi:hypothetical protein